MKTGGWGEGEGMIECGARLSGMGREGVSVGNQGPLTPKFGRVTRIFLKTDRRH